VGNDRALDELGARLRDSGQLMVMLDELPTNTGELSEYCNRLQVGGLERDAWRELLSWGEIVKPAHGLRYAHKAGALFRDYCAATNECDALIIAAPLSDDGDAVLLDDRTALVVAVEADKARVILAAVRRMVAAYVRECLRAQADADAGLPDAVLQNLAAQGVEAGTAASVARSHAAIRKRGRPTRCSMSARRAALVGCAAAVAPPIQARNPKPLEVRHE
jgi:hypothetical protein